MARLFVAQLTKTISEMPVLRGIDLSVTSGSLVAVLGASGSGKTTLLRLICGFERPDSGVIEVGEDLVSGAGIHIPPEKRGVGYVSQTGSLFPHLSVGDNVLFGLPRRGRRDRTRAEALLESVGLPRSYAARGPESLSGGEQQRVALARALAPSPKLLLLDEPFSSLDAGLRVETRLAVLNALRAAGATAVLVTHDQSEALSMGSEVAVLRDGVMAQVASPEDLYRRPVDARLAQFVGAAVILEGTVEDGVVDCILGRLPLASPATRGPADVMIRPEQIGLDPRPASGGPKARVASICYFGRDASVELELEGLSSTICAMVPGHRAPPRMAEVSLVVDGSVMAYPRAPESNSLEIWSARKVQPRATALALKRKST